MSEEKTYYEVQLDALNSIDKLKDKKAYCEKVDFSKCIEKDSDAQIIKDIKVFSVFPLKEIDKKKYGFNCVSCGEKITSETSPTKCVCGGTRFKNIIEYSKEEIKDELKKFQDPNLIELIKEEISKDHLEDNNLKTTVFLTGASSLLEDPKLRMSFQLTGDSAVGKNNCDRAITKHLPKDSFISITSGTQASLEDDIHDKRLIVFSEINLFREGGANRNLLETIKQISEDGTSALKKDLRKDNKEVRHEQGEQKSIIFSSTDVQQDEEAGTRFMKGSVEANPEVTKKVNENTLDNFSEMDFRLKNLNKDSSWIRKVLTYFFNKEKYLVVIPYAKFLKEKINEKYIFDYSSPRSRRDVKRLLALTCAMTWLYQEQREVKEYKGHKFLISEPKDLINTLKYSNEFFNQTYIGFDGRLNAVIKFIEEHPSEWVDKKEIQDFLGVTKNTINDYCRTLAEQGVQEGCKGSKLNEMEGEKMYDGNRIYYRRVQKEFKKSLVRVEMEELEMFLKAKKGSKSNIDIEDKEENKVFDLEKEEKEASNSKIEPFGLNPFTKEELKSTGLEKEYKEILEDQDD